MRSNDSDLESGEMLDVNVQSIIVEDSAESAAELLVLLKELPSMRIVEVECVIRPYLVSDLKEGDELRCVYDFHHEATFQKKDGRLEQVPCVRLISYEDGTLIGHDAAPMMLVTELERLVNEGAIKRRQTPFVITYLGRKASKKTDGSFGTFSIKPLKKAD